VIVMEGILFRMDLKAATFTTLDGNIGSE